MKMKQHFSLRKLSVGIASVSLGTVVLLSGVQNAHAEVNTNDPAVQKQIELSQKVAAEQEQKAQNQKAIDKQVELAKKAGAEQAQVETAKKVAAEQVTKAQAQVNQLANISKETKAIYNKKIAAAATADIASIVKDATAVNAQVELAQNAANEQKQVETAKKVSNEQVAKAKAEVNKLENLSKEKKADYNKQIAAAAVADIPGIVQNAKAEDSQISFAKKVANEQVVKAQNEVNKLKHLTKEEKTTFNKKIADAATADIPSIVKEATDADALKTKQGKDKQVTTSKKQVKDNQVATSTNKGNKQNQLVTGQKDHKATTASNKANVQQKAENAKKQLPATGEQDQVLFGLLSGSLFASAGTLFLLNARRRKENE